MSAIELVVAIALLGLLVTLAAALLGATSTGESAVTHASRASAEEGVAIDVLRGVLARAEIAPGRPTAFGDARRATFGSSCLDAMGDLRACDVSLAVTDGPAPPIALERVTEREVRFAVRASRLAYRNVDDSRPLSQWEATGRLPAAIAVIAGLDTLWLRLGRP